MVTNSSNSDASAGMAKAPVQLIDLDYERGRLQRLLNLNKGTNCQVVGPAGIGKTALLSNVGRLADESDGKFAVAYVRMADPDCQTLRGLLECSSAAWRVQPPFLRMIELDQWVKQQRRNGIRPVLCMDDFEEMVRLDREFTVDFFVELRSISESGLQIITTSRRTLSETLPWYARTSPFYTSFQILRLGPLPREASEQLLASLISGRTPLPSEAKEAILQFANGYPLALQVAAGIVRDHGAEHLQAALANAARELSAKLP